MRNVGFRLGVKSLACARVGGAMLALGLSACAGNLFEARTTYPEQSRASQLGPYQSPGRTAPPALPSRPKGTSPLAAAPPPAAITQSAGSVYTPAAPLPAAISPSGVTFSSDAERLSRLIAERATATPEKTYEIGPGDLIEVTVFGLPEMNRKVRVDTEGLIQLPLIDSVQVAHKSEVQVSREIAQLLTKFIREPQVTVFVQEYKSQQVAVTGSVAKPGLYALTRERRTILDMTSEAGGLTRDAGAIVEFIPARPGELAPTSPIALSNRTGGPPSDRRGISLQLDELMRGGGSLNMAVIPGDVIYVPEAGSFTIEGWIDKPGTYLITRNASVLAALSAGGGPLLPAQLSQVELLRKPEAPSASRDVTIVDLTAIRAGKQPDVELRSGDIIRVPGYVLLIIPWGLYTFVKTLVFFGASLPAL